MNLEQQERNSPNMYATFYECFFFLKKTVEKNIILEIYRGYKKSQFTLTLLLVKCILSLRLYLGYHDIINIARSMDRETCVGKSP